LGPSVGDLNADGFDDTSNRDRLGAIVKVTAGGSTYTKVFDGNSGCLSHSLYPLYQQDEGATMMPFHGSSITRIWLTATLVRT
jgi:hypothetical protein